MTGLLLWSGLVFALLVALGLTGYGLVLRRILMDQRGAISAAHPERIIDGAQSALVTTLALRQLGRQLGVTYPRTGPVFSLVISSDGLRLFGGRAATSIAEFSASQLVDVRVDTTSVGVANYTTLFIGVSACPTTFELPIRVMGRKPTSLMTASREWGEELASEIRRVINERKRSR